MVVVGVGVVGVVVVVMGVDGMVGGGDDMEDGFK